MSIVAKQKESKREQVPSGTHIARCFSMVHIGTTTWEYLGETKETDKVRISFEIPGEMRVFSEDQGEQPMVIDKEYTLSMHEKANLRKDLESWRGKTFSDKEAREFDILNLIGIPCSLGVIHKDTKGGNTYARISSISGIPKGIKAPDQINKNQIFDYNDNFSEDFIESLPTWIVEQIKETPEYKKIHSEDSTIVIDQMEKENNTNEDDCPF
jgi:hypothetical protein|tara:strand:- start:2595 stop:3230 length:636 start_codon:yes stop_codon:yes gene_type:complete